MCTTHWSEATQGLSSKLHIGMRLHPNGLLRVTLKGVAISDESFVSSNATYRYIYVYQYILVTVCAVCFNLA